VLVREKAPIDARDITQEYAFSYFRGGRVTFPMALVYR
jgi:hypothetical protein